MTDPLPEPQNLRFLRLLVTVLTGTMIIGIAAIVILLFIRLNHSGPVLPDSLTLPEGAKATAFTQGKGWVAVVTDRDEILIFDAGSGNLRQTIAVE